ncbi:MAG: enolase C-terminal domain-like protein [Pirellulaceae bacterium]
MRLTLKESTCGLRNSTTRIPFRYGTACLSRCPQATLRVIVEIRGRSQAGFSGDCLPPSWFDKSPTKDFAAQVADMLRVIAYARNVFEAEFGSESQFFPGWLQCQTRIQQQCQNWGLPPLLASFGASLLERAMIDAICRWHQVPFARAVRENLLGIDAGLVHPELRGREPRQWLPREPSPCVFVRQTVGLGDPLTREDIAPAERLEDGWPQAIEDYVTRRGVRYCKIKVSNQLDHDLARLTRIAEILQRHLGDHFRVTLDGNEQYKHAYEFEQLIDRIEATPALATLWNQVLVIEQPFDRAIALQADQIGELRALSSRKPVIIDESDGSLDAFAEAARLGYRGVSSKNCKGTFKSLLNAGLAWLWNQERGTADHFVMTGEDLCSVGIIPTQADLCLAATLGLRHVERNGHHYHPGLTYLPPEERRAALSAHADFYAEEHGIIGPAIVDGQFQLGSLQCPGFGFAVEPNMSARTPAEEWRFESLWEAG